MSQLIVAQQRCNRCGTCITACPFGALSLTADGVHIGDACRLCRQCIKHCPQGALSLVSDDGAPSETGAQAQPDLTAYRGVLVFAEQRDGRLQPVVPELIGKALELAGKVGQEVAVVLAGHDIAGLTHELRHYGCQRVIAYDHPELRQFRTQLYADVLTDAIELLKPGVVLIGATPAGRSLAPRIATRLRTGLTADCTVLDIRPNGDLVQTRPAFGGNVMATILTPRHRPQLATVRHKVMAAAPRQDEPSGEVISGRFRPEWQDRTRVVEVLRQAQAATISDADVVVAVGRGLRQQRDLELVERLATALGGMVGCTRPLVEQGWLPNTRQIGLSGRTVRPRLYIAAGLSGAIQHVAGMRGSDLIFAINQDRQAPIFDVAHYALVGDLYEIIPELTRQLTEGGGANAL